MFDQGSAPGPLPDAAGAGGGDVPAPNAAPPGAAVPGAESPDAPALAERLASLAPGADLAALVEGLMGGLLGPAAPAALREEAQGEPVLLDEGLLAPADLSLLRRARTREIGAAGALAADALGQMGAEVLSEVVAACRRLATWSQWALGVASACLARSPEMRTGPAPRGPGGRAERFVTPEETRFHASSEIACRLGVARTSAERLLDRGEGLLDGVFAPTECLHRCGLLDEAKTALVLSRLKGVAYEAAREVQERVLPRAPQRTRPQLARDIDRALAALDPQGAGARRRRNVAQRHVGRPSPRGEGVARMSLLLPTADAFLLDATLDAVAASARASGQERTLGQLRADALVGLCLHALRSSQHAAHRLGPGRAGEAVDPAVGVPAPAGGDGPADPPGPIGPPGPVDDPARGAVPDAERPRLLPDGVPLEGLLSSLSDLVGSSSPWWTPSGTGPVPLPPGLTVKVDVTVPLDQLLPDAAAPPPRAPGARPPSRGGPPDAPVLTAGGRSAPVPALLARALAAGGTWRRIVTDPLSGAVLDVGRTRYRPPAALADLVRARDRACTHPGCEIPAHRCDIDHLRPWARGGTTSLDNLTVLCQAHHRLKHTPGWSLARLDDGALLWRTPSGARYRREADGTILRLPRRIGPRSLVDPGGPVPADLAAAVTGPVLERLERGLAQAAPRAGAGEGRPRLETRGPRPGRSPGAFEAVPYPAALHELGLTALLDAVVPF